MGPFQQKRTPTAAHVRTSKFVAVTSMSIFEAEKKSDFAINSTPNNRQNWRSI